MKKLLNINFVFGLVIGIIVSSIVYVCAETIIAGNNISYDNTTSKLNSLNVQSAIDELNNKGVLGKEDIINKLNTKGAKLGSSATYQNILDVIESIPVGKTEDGEWGYVKEGETAVSPFSSGEYPSNVKLTYLWTYYGSDNAGSYCNFNGEITLNDWTGTITLYNYNYTNNVFYVDGVQIPTSDVSVSYSVSSSTTTVKVRKKGKKLTWTDYHYYGSALNKSVTFSSL